MAVGVPLLAACGDDSASTSTATDPTSSSTPSEESSSPSEDAGSSGGGAALASTSDVPVGGCFVVAASKIVLTQPTEGDFKAFTAVCTHQGCIVESSTEGEIPCPCHSQPVLPRRRLAAVRTGHGCTRPGGDHRRRGLDHPGLRSRCCIRV